MSVDEAFKKLMHGSKSASASPKPVTQPAASAPVGVAAPAAVTAVAEAPQPEDVQVVAEATPEPPKPTYPPLDLSRIRQAKRFAHHPIDSRSQIAEEYRLLRTRIQAMKLSPASILLTSCHHNEGKTSTALNLAMCMGRHRGSKILLVDFDLRRPRLHKMLGLAKQDHDVVSVLRSAPKRFWN